MNLIKLVAKSYLEKLPIRKKNILPTFVDKKSLQSNNIDCDIRLLVDDLEMPKQINGIW